MKKIIFKTREFYTVTDDDEKQFSVIVTHFFSPDSYNYKVESLDGTGVSGRKHSEILSYVLDNIDK